jgi:hypothetical protein
VFQVVFSSEGSMRPGELRSLVLQGDESASVEIKCFVGDPPQYGPCDECGQFRVSPDLPIAFRASGMLRGGDEIHILVSGDLSGETLTFAIPINGY